MLISPHTVTFTLLLTLLSSAAVYLSVDVMSLKALFAGGTVYRNIVWYSKGMKEYTRYSMEITEGGGDFHSVSKVVQYLETEESIRITLTEYISRISKHLKDVRDKFNSSTYDLFNNNCNSFSNELCQFLTSHTIPDYITNLPKEILETPFGAQLQPMLANMRGVTGTPSTQITQPSQPPPPPSPSTQDDREGSIKRIVSYGFTRLKASEELDNCNGDADKALRQLYNKATRF